MAVTLTSSNITAHQIIGLDGKPFPAAITSNVWIGTKGVFSQATGGNKVLPFTTGKKYFENLIQTFDAAKEEICIAGWQVSWDALLAPGVRLYDVLLKAAKRGVKVYVMPWDDTNPVQTYDDQTKLILESINGHPGVKDRPVHVVLGKSLTNKNAAYFSHHQKQVVVDRKIAYVGGIDLCYGRYDDETFDLQADKDGREVLNRYNGCVAQVLPLKEDDKRLVDPDLMKGAGDKLWPGGPNYESNSQIQAARLAAGGWQVPYEASGMVGTVSNNPTIDANTEKYLTLDPECQPRMPWQDVHSRIEGPAVSDLLRNFVGRWRAAGGKALEPPKPPSAYAIEGETSIQVLRSAPIKLVTAEGKKADESVTEDHIHQAMLQLIDKSRHFIYIENQFFVSDFGEFADFAGPGRALSPAAQFIKDGDAGIADYKLRAARMAYRDTVVGDIDRIPTNQICARLVTRIQTAIMDIKRPKFHVYITLPVHPEGALNDATVAVQVYWTMQTLSFGKKSLLNGIRRAIKARELFDAKDPDHLRVTRDMDNTEWESVPVEACYEHVTLLNLRNHKKLTGPKGERYVSEQVYVHTKLMIVDDLYALYGSANINDRSLLGERDSEIAVLVVDKDGGRADINGTGSNRPVRAFAHQLRTEIWEKLFGITAGGSRAATSLQSAIKAPGSPDSWRRIQAQAQKNADAYEAAFPFVAKNWSGKFLQNGQPVPASILPTWNPELVVPPTENESGNLASPLPFQPRFWSAPQHNPAGVSQLDSIKGFFTALPIEWTRGENIHIKFPVALVADINDLKLQAPGQPTTTYAGVGNRPASSTSTQGSPA